jgi:hypothetical protein
MIKAVHNADRRKDGSEGAQPGTLRIPLRAVEF